MRQVAALFVRGDSTYKRMPGVDAWDLERDARLWPGGSHVVAHPPCARWSSLNNLVLVRYPHRAAERAHGAGRRGEMKNTPKGANRDASTGQSHGAEGSASPNGRGTDGAPACGAAPAFPIPERRVSQHVVKATAARPDGLTACQ